MSMKENVMFPVMKHNVNRFILRPSHYLISSSEQSLKLLELIQDENLKESINNIIANNKKAFIQDFETALLFNNKIENEGKPLTISFHEWWNACSSFKLDYTYLIALFLERNQYEVLFDEFIERHMDKNNVSDFFSKLVQEMVILYDFKNIYSLKKYVKNYYPEILVFINQTISKTFKNTPNFLNLITLHHSHEESVDVLSSVNVFDIDLQDIVLTNRDWRNKKDKPLSNHEKERLLKRLTVLMDSSLLDNDSVLTDKEIVFHAGDRKDKEYRKTLSYVYNHLKHEEEKEIFLNIIKNKRKTT